MQDETVVPEERVAGYPVVAVDAALAGFETNPWVLQEFKRGRLVEHPYWDDASGSVQTMTGRVRLCPYYFVDGKKVRLGGVLATIVPADKKVIHGMRDGVLVPVISQ